MYEIPTSVILDGNPYTIRNRGDFRMVMDCFTALEDLELTKQERLISCLLIFYEDLNSIQDIYKLPDIQQAVIEMYKFFNCNEEDSDRKVPYKLVDWQKDEQIISSAINAVANKEIRLEPYLHWWTFVGYYLAVGESLLSSVIGIRKKIVTGKPLEKHERKFRVENPQYFIWNSKTLDQKEAEQEVLQLWNKE